MKQTDIEKREAFCKAFEINVPLNTRLQPYGECVVDKLQDDLWRSRNIYEGVKLSSRMFKIINSPTEIEIEFKGVVYKNYKSLYQDVYRYVRREYQRNLEKQLTNKR